MNHELAFELKWDGPVTSEAGSSTWGHVQMSSGSHVLWGRRTRGGMQGLRWTWVDFLEHLSQVWPWLLHEEAVKLGSTPLLGSHRDLTLRFASEEWRESLPPEDHDEFLRFRRCHDLAMGLPGMFAPSVWVIREGNRFWVGTADAGDYVSESQLRGALEALALKIVDRLSSLTDERAVEAIRAWKRREDLELLDAVTLAVGNTEEELRAALNHGQDVMALLGVLDTGSVWRSPQVAAARMTLGYTAPHVVERIVKAVGSAARLDTPKLDAMTAAATLVRFEDSDPAKQGSQLARWLRERLKLRDEERAAPDAVLADWEVSVTDLPLSDPGIEAVATWGGEHGPAIFVNPRGKYSQSAWGRRATLSHEICHLLRDRREGLPLVDVLGGLSPARLESRANAFAAEFLLPKQIAGAAFERSADPSKTLGLLADTYGVGFELIAWQAYNAPQKMSWETFTRLRLEISSRPEAFTWRVRWSTPG